MHYLQIGSTAERGFSETPAVEEYCGFYMVYGECFAAWSDVEARLHAIFIVLLKSPEYAAASAAFYSTVGFRAKLSMVDEVIASSKSMQLEDLTEWKSIYDEASKKARRRNELAHNTVYFGRVKDSDVRKMFLGDPRTPSTKSRLHSHDLTEIRESFYALGQRMWTLWQRLRPQNEQQA